MLRLRDGPHFGVETPHQETGILQGTDQHLDGNQLAHELMFGFEHHSHTAGADPAQDAVIAQDEAKGFAGLDARP